MSKRQKLSGVAYRKLKVTREREERKSAASLQVFKQKKYIAKAKCKDEDAESALGRKECEENANMMETNIEIEVEEEFPVGINIVKEIESDNYDVPKNKKESPRACSKYEYE